MTEETNTVPRRLRTGEIKFNRVARNVPGLADGAGHAGITIERDGLCVGIPLAPHAGGMLGYPPGAWNWIVMESATGASLAGGLDYGIAQAGIATLAPLFAAYTAHVASGGPKSKGPEMEALRDAINALNAQAEKARTEAPLLHSLHQLAGMNACAIKGTDGLTEDEINEFANLDEMHDLVGDQGMVMRGDRFFGSDFRPAYMLVDIDDPSIVHGAGSHLAIMAHLLIELGLI